MNCVCGVITEDLTGEQAYDFLFERASALFCSINWVENSSWLRNRVLRSIFVRTNVFFATWFILSKPSTPVRNAAHARIYRPFVLQAIFMRLKRLFFLWHSLIRSLYFIQIYIHKKTSPHSWAFQTLYFTPIFSNITSSEIFFLSFCCRWSAKARNI